MYRAARCDLPARCYWRLRICSPCINVHDNKVATCIHGRPECLVNISTPAHVLWTTRSLLPEASWIVRTVRAMQATPRSRRPVASEGALP